MLGGVYSKVDLNTPWLWPLDYDTVLRRFPSLCNLTFQITRCVWTETKHELVLLHYFKGWRNTWIWITYRPILCLHTYCVLALASDIRIHSKKEWKMSISHTARNRAFFFFYRCIRRLKVRGSLGISQRGGGGIFKPIWLVYKITIAKSSLREAEHLPLLVTSTRMSL